MVEDPRWELALLATVQAFYQRLLSDQLRGELPTPAGLAPDLLAQTSDIHSTLNQMHLWIEVLDMAITPARLRRALQPDLDPEIAEALLRYLVRHRDDSASSRDKTDLVATFLFRYPRVPGQWDRRGVGLDGSIPLAPFEIALLEILSESDIPVLVEADAELLREFGPLLDQANLFQDFAALMDSGIIQRVRELKATLGDSIFHPGVLATLAPYNAAFGVQFSALFAAAAQEIKTFALGVEKLGGNILSTVDGVEVTVEHIAALNQQALLTVDYAEALEKFQRVARLKKDLSKRPAIRRASSDCTPVTAPVRATAAPAGASKSALPPRYTPPALTPHVVLIEEAKLRRVEESIRVFVRVADPKFRQIVPMRYFNLTLTPAEIEACTADYLEQPGSRADAARTLLRGVAVKARISTEIEELRRVQNSSSLWKLHADSLAVLIDLAQRLTEGLNLHNRAIAQRAEKQSNNELLRNSLDTLRERTYEAAQLLREA